MSRREKAMEGVTVGKGGEMKKISVIFLIMVAVAFSTTAWATPKWVEAVPSYCQSNGNVTIPPLPTGCKLLNVFIFDDVRGTTKSFGPVRHFQLKPGQGFNFTWKDATGNIWWQMITPRSVAKGLVIDCTDSRGCKYLVPLAK